VTILFFSDNPWHSLYQRPQHLASRFSEHSAVLWIEPVTLGHKRFFAPEEVRPGVRALSIPLLPHNARQRWMRVLSHVLSSLPQVRWVELRIQLFLLRRALRKTGTDPGSVVLFLQNFQLIRLARKLKAPLLVFDYIDDAFGFTDFPVHVRGLWLETVRTADIITVTSPTLNRIVREATPGPAIHLHTVTNGVEYERFAQKLSGTPADDLPPEGTPLIGYVGSVYPWLDFNLLETILKSISHATLVLVGRKHPEVGKMVSELSGYRNFLYLGTKPYDQVPWYLHRFSVGIIPFRKTRLTAAVNPVKLYEYSACGLPTVSTDFSDDLSEFEHIISVCHSHAEFVAQLQNAIEQKKDNTFIEELQSFARENDWDRKGSVIRSIIENVLASRSS
jgi:glycosyltransferase involved in cell wall biosynthesis